VQRVLQARPYGAGGVEKCLQHRRAVLGAEGQGEFGQLGARAYLADPDARARHGSHAGGAKADADPAGGQADDGVHGPGGEVGNGLEAVREHGASAAVVAGSWSGGDMMSVCLPAGRS
jgi:hypothetical protein